MEKQEEKMTLDEAIIHARDVAEKKYLEGMLCHANPNDEELDGCIECAREHEQLAQWLEELKHYKQLGTLEEVQEAVEKQNAKKPKRDCIYHHLTRWCEKCNSVVLSRWKYCPDCGQSIDWSDEE